MIKKKQEQIQIHMRGGGDLQGNERRVYHEQGKDQGRF